MGRVISVKVNGFSCKSTFRGQRQAVISAAGVAADRSPCAGSVVCVAVTRVCTAESREGVAAQSQVYCLCRASSAGEAF